MSSEANHGVAKFLDVNTLFTPRNCILLLGLLIFAGFPDVVLGMKTFFHHDFGNFYYPSAFYHREQFWKGHFPLWNPWNNCGLPFFAQWNTMVLYPGSLFYLIFPLSWSLGVFCLLHQWLGGVGMFYLARKWTGNSFAAMIAAVGYSFGGLMLSCLCYPNNSAALGWMPWVILATETATMKGGKQIVVAALVAAIQFLAGAPEIFLFTWILNIVFFAVRWFRATGEKSRTILRMLVLGAIAMGLVMVQLLPFLQLLEHSQRTTNYADYSSSMPSTGWANFLIPIFRCFDARYGVFMQVDQNWIISYYSGIVVVALALAAVVVTKDLIARIVAAIAFIGMVLALGPNGSAYVWIKSVIPGLGFINFPIKFIVLSAFALPLLAAYAIAEWQKNYSRGKRICVVYAVLLASIVGLLIFNRQHHFVWERWDLTWKNALSRAVILLGSGLLLIGVARKSDWTKGLLALALILLMAIDGMTHLPVHNPTISRTIYEPHAEHPDMSPPPRLGESRVMMDAVTYDNISSSKIRDPFTHYVGLRLMMLENFNLLDHIPKADGFYSLYLREMEDFRRLLLTSTNELGPIKDMLGISYTTTPDKLLAWQRRESYLPFITAGQRPMFVPGTNTFAAVQRADFNPHETVYLPIETQPAVNVPQRSSVTISGSAVTEHRIDAKVSASSSALLVVSQSFYPLWHAYVDDKPTELLRANHALQAVEVPEGNHHIVIKYEDRRFHLGAVISVATFLICLLYCWRYKPAVRQADS